MQLLNKKRTYESDRVFYLPVSQIMPNVDQPRRDFDQAALSELAESICRCGILQPLSVRRKKGGYELIAGERRLRAAKLAGFREVPCLVLGAEEEESAYLALIENLQRRDLNFMEEATAIAKLIEKYDLSQEMAAEKIGKSQSAVANKLRLLRLSPECVQQLLEHGLTERHGRALLRLESEEERMTALRTIVEKQMNVAKTEEYIDKLLEKKHIIPQKKPNFIIKDVRLFLNSISHSVDVMRRSGVDAKSTREESEEEITLTIHIPKQKARV